MLYRQIARIALEVGLGSGCTIACYRCQRVDEEGGRYLRRYAESVSACFSTFGNGSMDNDFLENEVGVTICFGKGDNILNVYVVSKI